MDANEGEWGRFAVLMILAVGSLGAQQTTVALSTSGSSTILGQPVTLTAMVTPAAASGTVTFYEGTTVLGSATLANGHATVTVMGLGLGTHQFNGVYAGDGVFAGSYTPVVTQVVTLATASSTRLASSVNPATYGQIVTLTATVTPSSATGKVTFFDGTTALGSGTLAGGQAVLSIGQPGFGARSLTAIYNGDANNAVSKSAVLVETVRTVAGNGFSSLMNLGIPSGSQYETGDFNGDGIPDVAVSSGSEVSVYLGKGDGTFHAAVNSPIGSGPFVIGDFNRDGRADIVTVSTLGTISVILGNGDGSFQPALTQTLPLMPPPADGIFSFVVGDFNGDGKLDILAVGGANRDTLITVFGNGDGTFQQQPVSFVAGGYLADLAVGDFDGDGIADLAAVDSDTGLRILPGNGDGTFRHAGSYPVGEGVLSVVVGDFNGDGKLDVAGTAYLNISPGTSEVYVMLGNGDGTLQPAKINEVGAYPTDLAIGDFNGDGIADLAVPDGNPVNKLWVLYGKGDGTFQSPTTFFALSTYFAPSWPGQPMLGDFNGDGRQDILLGTSNGFLNVLLGTFLPPSTTVLTLSRNSSAYGQSVGLTAVVSPSNATGDVAFYDGTVMLETKPLVNGQATLATSFLAPGTHSLKAYYAGGSYFPSASATLEETVNPVSAGGFQAAVNYVTGGDPVFAAVGDFNGDGKTDLAVVNEAGNTVSILLGNGDGTFGAAVNYAAGSEPASVAVGDFNGDGVPDLIFGSGVILLGNGDGTFRAGVNYDAGGNFDVTVGDFNLDGKVDITVAMSYQNAYVALGNGDGTFGQAQYYNTGDSTASVSSATADFNGDGKPDLAFVNSGESTMSVLLGGIAGLFQFRVNYATGSGPDSVATGDFNGDGKPDLVTANGGGNNVSVFLGNGDGTFQPAVTYAAGSQPTFVAVGDVNGDGKIDLVVASASGVSVLFGNGNGTFQTAVNYGAVGAATSVAIGDFNGDGRADVAVTTAAGMSVLLGMAPASGLDFYPVPPCRVADTRSGAGESGAFGPPSLAAGMARSFPIPSGSCGIPATAGAYSLNFTVAPQGYLGVFTTWPTGQAQPGVSTLNSYNGSVVANAAIVPAGTGGAISVEATNATDVLFDINGYFAAPLASGMQFYPVTPCRVADTRAGAGKSGAFGPPSMAAGMTRAFPVPSSGCGIPATAAAYSMNFTVVPHGYLGVLTTWPTGEAQPNVSTLNSYSGTVVANAAIVPAGSGGAISVYASDATDVLFDINGYFAPPGAGLQFYPVTPCRVVDTRSGAGKSGAFGPPSMAAGMARSFPIPSGSCGIPATAAAYSLNFTVAPQGYLGVLTTWPTGQSQPNVSTLNSYSGAVVANAAMVPAGSGGAISVYVSDATDLVLDVNGYFGP